MAVAEIAETDSSAVPITDADVTGFGLSCYFAAAAVAETTDADADANPLTQFFFTISKDNSWK